MLHWRWLAHLPCPFRNKYKLVSNESPILNSTPTTISPKGIVETWLTPFENTLTWIAFNYNDIKDSKSKLNTKTFWTDWDFKFCFNMAWLWIVINVKNLKRNFLLSFINFPRTCGNVFLANLTVILLLNLCWNCVNGCIVLFQVLDSSHFKVKT